MQQNSPNGALGRAVGADYVGANNIPGDGGHTTRVGFRRSLGNPRDRRRSAPARCPRSVTIRSRSGVAALGLNVQQNTLSEGLAAPTPPEYVVPDNLCRDC